MQKNKHSPVTQELWYEGQKTMATHIKNINKRLDTTQRNQNEIVSILKKLSEIIKNDRRK